jgi:HAD superfamily hydrolase (TIGR01549 family)
MIKIIIRKIVVTFLGKNISKISKDYLLEKEVISFDLFDTLILRRLGDPKNVFREIDKKLIEENKQNKEFVFQRISAEKRARRMKGKREVTLDEIYSLFDTNVFGNSEKLKKMELETEYDTCISNHEMQNLYRYLLESGKRIVLTTDMYLPRKAIEKILKKCGIEEYDKLFISSEIGLMKKYGQLFDYMLKELDVDPNEIVHIGDNPRGDYLVPRLKGIRSILYKR